MTRSGGRASRDREEYAEGDAKARARRARVAHEIAVNLAGQVEALIAEGPMLGGRGLVVGRLQTVLAAERAGDDVALRAAVVDLSAACGTWAAALDLGVALSAGG